MQDQFLSSNFGLTLNGISSVTPHPHDSRFVVVVTAHGNGVPEGIDLGASVVHDPSQPGKDGGGGVTMAVVKGIRLNPTHTK